MESEILRCPVCGKVPGWHLWKTCVPETPAMWALFCNDRCHHLHTSFSVDKELVIRYWEKMVLDWR